MKNIVVISEMSEINEAVLKKANSIAAPLNAKVTIASYIATKNRKADSNLELAQIKNLTAKLFTDVKSISYDNI